MYYDKGGRSLPYNSATSARPSTAFADPRSMVAGPAGAWMLMSNETFMDRADPFWSPWSTLGSQSVGNPPDASPGSPKEESSFRSVPVSSRYSPGGMSLRTNVQPSSAAILPCRARLEVPTKNPRAVVHFRPGGR